MWDLFTGHKRSLTLSGANNRSFVSTLQNYFEYFHSCSPLPDSGRGAGGEGLRAEMGFRESLGFFV